MVTKDDVRAAMNAHSSWYAEDIADLLRCTPEYVRATANRNGWTFKPRLHVRHVRIPQEWVDRAKRKGETQRQTLDRIFGLR